MSTKIFVNLPVKDLNKSMDFFKALGWTFNRIAGAAITAGAREAKPPQDYGFMQLRTFLDLDGHHWEILYMDPAHVQPKT